MNPVVRPILRRLVIVLVSTTAALGAAELCVRWTCPRLGVLQDAVEWVADRRGYVIRCNMVVDFGGLHEHFATPVRWQSNSLAFRCDRKVSAEPAPGSFRVLTYGDSEAFGWSVSFADTFQEVLEREDPTLEVLNLGVPGYNLDNIVEHVRRTCRQLHPDLVVYLVNPNDYGDAWKCLGVPIDSELLRYLVFAHAVLVSDPASSQDADNAARAAQFGSRLRELHEYCSRQNLPLLMAFASSRDFTMWSGQVGGAHVDVSQAFATVPLIDSHLGSTGHRVLAGLLRPVIDRLR